MKAYALLATLFLVSSLAPAIDQPPIPNPAIDFPAFQRLAARVAPLREERRLSESQFLALAAEPGTVILDARSADKYALRHIRGAISLPFTDFTAETLALAIPRKNTRVLIYCNNNFQGAKASLPLKVAAASLNISTYIALTTYGYTNVYELGPLLDVATTRLPFAGSEVEQPLAKRAAPRPVKPVAAGSVVYSAPSEAMGCVVAADPATGRELFRKRIYSVSIDPELERDVQEVFITSLSIQDGNTLVIENERGDRYALDLNTRVVVKRD